MRHQLVCLQGINAGVVTPLGEELVTFGNHVSATCRIASSAFAHHAELRYQGSQHVLYDLTNQATIKVNGERIAQHVLMSGDHIEIADNEFVYEQTGNESTMKAPVRLVVMSGALSGNIYPLGVRTMTFGRNPSNTIRVQNKLASRHHAEIRADNSNYVLHDLQSQNGTFVNGEQIDTRVLQDKDVIGIGNQQFRFEMSEKAQSKRVDPRHQGWNPIHAVLDFQVQGNAVQIAWNAPIAGERITRLTLPYRQSELPAVIRALDAVQYPTYPFDGPSFSEADRTTLTRLNLWHEGRVVADIGRRIGKRLYSVLGADGRSALDAVRNYAITVERSICYVLRFPDHAAALAALPWELMHDDREPVLIGRNKRVDSCERYLITGRVQIPEPSPAHRPHILALSPAYEITHDLRAAERVARLTTWDRLRDQGKLSYEEITPLTPRRLREHLQRMPQPPDIIHYFGHGVSRNGEGYLYFDDGEGGTTMISTAQLMMLFDHVKLIVIYACQSSKVGPGDSLVTGVAPALSLVSEAVVGMQFTVRSSAAICFSEVFYDMLLSQGRSLQESVTRARQALFLEEPDGASWYVPTLYLRSRDRRPLYFSGL